MVPANLIAHATRAVRLAAAAVTTRAGRHSSILVMRIDRAWRPTLVAAIHAWFDAQARDHGHHSMPM